MANLELLFFFVILIIFLLSTPTSHAKRNIPNNYTNPFNFDYKTYLKRFGYLNEAGPINDDALNSAIKTFQENYGIEPMGSLDAATISQMKAPRCGVADIINGTNYMQRRRRFSPQYGFLQRGAGLAKWEKFQLTYKYLEDDDFPDFAKLAIEQAFEKWASVSSFVFTEEKRSFLGGDLNIGFYRGDHGDGYPFDGRAGKLAHTFLPADGRIHFDLDEEWFRGGPSNRDYSYHLDTVALHEIGHALGLGHSALEEAVMYPSISPGEVKDALDDDDIEGIQDLYDTD